jgi:hypothetical protein
MQAQLKSMVRLPTSGILILKYENIKPIMTAIPKD